jgi:hypothetical protein
MDFFALTAVGWRQAFLACCVLTDPVPEAFSTLEVFEVAPTHDELVRGCSGPASDRGCGRCAKDFRPEQVKIRC